MKIERSTRLITIVNQAEEFLKKRPDHAASIPTEDVRLLVSELVNCLFSLTENSEPKLDHSNQIARSTTGKISINKQGYIVRADENIAIILGRDVHHLRENRIQSYLARKSKKRFNQYYMIAFENRKEQHCQVELVNSQGTSFHALLKIKPQPDQQEEIQLVDASFQINR